MKINFLNMAVVSVALLVLTSARAMAAVEVYEIATLDFGSFAVINDDAQYEIVIDPDNSITYDPQIIPHIDGHRAQYDFTGLPANVTFYVGVTVPVPPDGGVELSNPSTLTNGSQSFTLENLTADDLVTDNNGDGTLYIGGTLKTAGLGSPYDSGTYSGQYDITLYY